MIINKDLMVENKQYSLGGLCDTVNAIKGTILWENSGTWSNFTEREISIPTLKDYSYIEVLYWTETIVGNWSYQDTSGKLSRGNGTKYQIGRYVASSTRDTNLQWFGRDFTINSDSTKITFGNGYNRDNSNFNVRNSSGVPILIVGYKAY